MNILVDKEELTRLRDDNLMLRSELDQAKGQLCRAREALNQLKKSRNDIEDLRAISALPAALLSVSPCEHEVGISKSSGEAK
jgi:hypothetical protein